MIANTCGQRLDSCPRIRVSSRRKANQQGFSLLLVVMCCSVMFGMMGLAFDLGRMFIVKNELQTFVDASALAASRQLDGTGAGIQNAHTIATAGPFGSAQPNGWNFNSSTISNVTDAYGTSLSGNFDPYANASGASSNGYRLVKVTANATVPLYFLAAIPGLPTSQLVQTSAIGGQSPNSTIAGGGLAPFAPDAHDQSDTRNFGFTPGVQYTLKWAHGNTTTCNGDAGFTPSGTPPSGHGFVNIGQGGTTNSVRNAVTYSSYPNSSAQPATVTAGDTLFTASGSRSTIFGALSDRASQDSDDASSNWAEYRVAGLGNGRRVITVPVAGTWTGTGNSAQTTVLGFANFFLKTQYEGSGSICATYIGPGNLNGAVTGGTDGTKVYSLTLYQ